jgi:hypothetical protein
MTLHDASRSAWYTPQQLAVAEARTAWRIANGRCGEALRAWRDAAPAARPDAYRDYLAELGREEAAAAELALHALPLAA